MMLRIMDDQRYQRGISIASRTVLWTFLLLGVFLTIFPFLWSGLLSTHDRSTMFSSNFVLHFSNQLLPNY
ncbi:MAG: hypothetical protein WED11_01655, partial [Natronospirillum sp.]